MQLSALEKAAQNDAAEIIALIRRVVDDLNRRGIPQWDDVYPRAENVEEDIRKGELYVSRADGRIAGIITLNRECDPDYQNGDWEYAGPDFRVVHRLCVSPDAQGQGVGRQMMGMAEDMLREQGVQSVRLDAFVKNPYSIRLYQKLGYRVAGEATWRKGLFFLMEKNIAEDHGREQE